MTQQWSTGNNAFTTKWRVFVTVSSVALNIMWCGCSTMQSYNISGYNIATMNTGILFHFGRNYTWPSCTLSPIRFGHLKVLANDERGTFSPVCFSRARSVLQILPACEYYNSKFHHVSMTHILQHQKTCCNIPIRRVPCHFATLINQGVWGY